MKIMHKVISLSNQIERRRNILKEFGKAEVEFSFYDAINGIKELNSSEYCYSDNPYHRAMSLGEIGCYLSHIAVINDFLGSDATHLIVYEDDVSLAKNFICELDNLNAISLDDRATIYLLGYRNSYISRWCKSSIGTNKLGVACDYAWGAHGYCLNKKAAKTIVDNFSQPYIPFDCITSGYYKKYKKWRNVPLTIRVLERKIINLDNDLSSDSTIEDRVVGNIRRKNILRDLLVRVIKQIMPPRSFFYE